MSGQLVSLEIRHAEALRSFLADFDEAGETIHGYFCEHDWPIRRAIDTLAAWARGEELKGYVPNTTLFWEEDRDLRGVINVRHRLSPSLREWGGHIGYSVAPAFRRHGVATRMLSAVLDPCRALGLQRALLTCDPANHGSWRAIENNGGVLEREAWVELRGEKQRWYWIDLG